MDTGATGPRLLLVSSHRGPDFDRLTSAEHFARTPYSTAAILHHLELRGWTTARAGIRTGCSPRALARRIDAFRPDIVYTYGALNALLPLWLRRGACRYRQFVVVHGWDDVYGDIWRAVYGRLPGLLMDRIERAIVRGSDAVVTLSLHNLARGRAWGVASHFIPNGADEPCYDLAACQLKLEGRFNIVYAGDQARWKRTADACAAMRRLPPDIRLYLTGQHYAHLDPYAAANCIFLGYLPRHDQLCVMAQADALVVTADQECNAKIQEYLRFRKPIVAYDGRPNLFFTNGRNALLTRDYAAAFRRLADDPALGRFLAENAARDLPVETWAQIAGRFHSLFTALLASRNGSAGSAPPATARARPRLLYVDHAFHRTTHSTRFLRDLLADEFEIVERYATGRFGRAMRGMRATARTCDAVLCFQLLPSLWALWRWRRPCLYVPMYDAEAFNPWQWRRLARMGVRIISFSRRLTAYVERLGLAPLTVRYVPSGLSPAPGNPRAVFLWERGDIGFDALRRMFQPRDVDRVVLLRRPDAVTAPRIPLREEDRVAYAVEEIVESGFGDREAYLARMRDCGVFVAPRRKEGIGMAFLEALAMGKCVVAHCDATMDEYIEHGVTGYLVDMHQPVYVGTDGVRAIQKNVTDMWPRHAARWQDDVARIRACVRAALGQPVRMSWRDRVAWFALWPLQVAGDVRTLARRLRARRARSMA